MPYAADRKIDRCLDCGSCRELVLCPGGGEVCIGCGACALVSNSTLKGRSLPSRNTGGG